MAHLEESLLDDDLTKTAVELRFRFSSYSGRHDLQTIFEMIQESHKEFLIFEKSAHLVRYAEPEKLLRILINRVRPLSD